MAKLLFNITNGTNNPTKASLGFMLARTAVEEGHDVTVFLNADAVSLMRAPVLDNLVGLGTGKLKEHFDILKQGKVDIYVCLTFFILRIYFNCIISFCSLKS